MANCYVACDQVLQALTADAATATPAEKAAAVAALGITASTPVPDATNTVKGISALNLGNAAGDDNNATDAWTSAAFVAQATAAGTNAIKSAIVAAVPPGATVPDATNTVKGISALNLGDAAGDDNNAVDAWTSSSFVALATAAGSNAIKTAIAANASGGGSPVAATDTVAGISALNTGSAIATDPTNATDALVASGFNALINAAGVATTPNAMQTATLNMLKDSGVFSPGGSLHVRESYAANVNAPSTAAGNNDRDFLQLDAYGYHTTIGATLVGGILTLPAGTYRINGYTTAYEAGECSASLVNAASGAILIRSAIGNDNSATLTDSQIHLPLDGVINLASTTGVVVRMFVTNPSPTGQGKALLSGTASTFTSLTITKLEF